MVAKLSIGIRNDLNKVGFFEVHGLELTAGNIVAQLADAAALQAAVEGLSIGTFASRSLATDRVQNATIPTFEVQLGDKWIITSVDAGGNKYTNSIPAEDSDGGTNLISGTHNADLTAAPWVAFIAAFNAYAVNRVGGALTFVSARLGTRLGT